MKKLRIGAIIPVYNTERWLTDCLESVVNQSVPFDSVVIVNDGSTDGSLEICRAYDASYNDVRLIEQINHGLSYARNVGLDYISADYVMFLDSDDYLDLNAVKIIRDLCKKDMPDIISFNGASVIENENIVEYEGQYVRRHSEAGIIHSGKELFYLTYPKVYRPSACMSAFRLEYLKSVDISFPNGINYEDNYFTFFCMNQARKAIFIENLLYFRRYRAGSITTSEIKAKDLSDKARCFLLIMKELTERIRDWENNDAIRIFVSDISASLSMDYKKFCKYNQTMPVEYREDVNAFYKEFLSYLTTLNVGEEMSIESQISFVCSLGEVDDAFISKTQKSGIAKKLIPRIREFYLRLLHDTKLGDEMSVVGIYGSGAHTDSMLDIYQELIGTIKARVVIIDSARVGGEYRGWPIINVASIKEGVDQIIISSFLYEEEMYNRLLLIKKDVKIVRFYNGYKTNIFPNNKSLHYALGVY